MPRKSRKEITTSTTHTTTTKAAIYARLSFEDGIENQISNQISLVKSFIEGKPDLTMVDIFKDSGETGTDFNRQGFNDMMEAAGLGKIDCIVVKDLSRFGRNYIETGHLLEKIFPAMGLRLISVNDNYDSANPASHSSLAISLKSLVNHLYAKDISSKVSAVFAAKRKRGEYISSHPPYGYVKSDLRKNMLEIDPITAPVVKEIFRMKLEGMGNTQIARRLNDLGFASPSKYRGIRDNLWQQQSIKVILKNPVYIGRVGLVDGICEAIVDNETFEAVNAMLAETKKAYDAKIGKYSYLDNPQDSENIFKGMLYCGDCGKKLIRYKEVRHRRNPPIIYYSYICQNFEQNRDRACGGRKSIGEKVLKQVVWESIRMQIELYSDSLATATKTPQLSETSQATIKINQFENRLAALYDDYSEGILAEDEYLFAKSKYQDELGALRANLHKVEVELAIKETALKFKQEAELTRAMLLALIDRITIFEKDRILIKFKFGGGFDGQ